LGLVVQKILAPDSSGALLFCWDFWGCFGKSGVLWWCFCGQDVMECVAIVTLKLRVAEGWKLCSFENISVEKK
jgi:hypothetical protein